MTTNKTRKPRKKPEPKKAPVITQEPGEESFFEELHPKFIVNPVTGEEDPLCGIDYDFDRINKKFRTLGCPTDEYWDPTNTIPWGHAKYMCCLSARSVGKTTQILLWCMCAHKIYQSQLVYVRENRDELAPKLLDSKSGTGLFAAIRAFNYIPKLTDGKYNDALYFGGVWRYIKRNPETGEVDEKGPAFMQTVAVSDSEVVKSSLTAPRADFIIYDEFVSSTATETTFIDFCQLTKTIIRERLSPIIFMLGNITDQYNPMFRELCIRHVVATLPEGESTLVQTTKGTRLWVAYMGAKNKVRPILNTTYYGFDDTRLNSIVGGSWDFQNYPHIYRNESRVVLQKGIIVLYQGNIIELEICMDDDVGLHICAHTLRKMPQDKDVVTCYTLGEIRKPYEVFKFGKHRPIDKLVWKDLYEMNKVYFSHNDVGNLLDHFVNEA